MEFGIEDTRTGLFQVASDEVHSPRILFDGQTQRHHQRPESLHRDADHAGQLRLRLAGLGNESFQCGSHLVVPLGHDAIFFRTLQQVADLFQAVSLREMSQLQFDPAALLFEFRPPRLEQLHRPLMPRGLLAESLNGLPLGQAGRHTVQVGSCPARLDRRQLIGDMLIEFGQRYDE